MADAARIRRIAAAILLGIAAAEALPLAFSVRALRRALVHPQTVVDVAAAALIAAAYVAYSVRVPGIRRHLGDRSWVRLPAVVLALVAGIFEEAFFRSSLMNGIAAAGAGIAVQIAASALAFGAVHAVWGTFGGVRVLLGAMSATTVLGLALAVLYAANGRVLVPCIEAHVAIDLVLEPALVLFALESGMARRQRRDVARRSEA